MLRKAKANGVLEFHPPPTVEHLLKVTNDGNLGAAEHGAAEPAAGCVGNDCILERINEATADAQWRLKPRPEHAHALSRWLFVELHGYPAPARWALDWMRLGTHPRTVVHKFDVDPWSVPVDVEFWRNSPATFLAVVAAHEVNANRALIEAEPAHALHALRVLTTAGVPPPIWLLAIINRCSNEVTSHAASGYDEAFGLRPATHRKREWRQRDEKLRQPVWTAVYINRARGRALDDNLFEEIGAWLYATGQSQSGGKSTAKALYRKALASGLPDVSKVFSKHRN